MQFQKAVRPLRGEISVPGDKSISHRAVMFGAISEGTTEVTNFLQGADCLSTISCFRSMGIEIENTPERILVHGKGLHGLSAPSAVLDCGNSGTTTRLISGILAGQNFSSTLTGDASIQKRPMGRIINPLTQMGASIRSIPENGCAPLAINGHPLHAISYLSPVASAQVKSCVLLAGLYADGKTSVTEPALSRNHTELMLKFFGADVASEGLTASVLPDPDLHGNLVRVPGDISSAAYFIAAALIVPGSEVLLKNVGINPTRDGMLRVCRAMGADITLLNEQNSGGEPVADLLVRYTPSLSGTVIEGELIPTLIDEIPIIAVLAATANGTTVIRNAEELKVKESNRLDIMVNELTAMGVSLEGTDDGMIIEGGKPFHGAQIDSRLDHRIAMSFAIASLAAETPTEILRAGCVDISYPTFYQDLTRLQAYKTVKQKMDCEDHFLTIHFFAFIYAGNEPKSVLARDLGDCRNNLRNSRSMFLIVLFFRPFQPFLPAVPAFRFQAANNSRSVFPALRFPSVPERSLSNHRRQNSLSLRRAVHVSPLRHFH